MTACTTAPRGLQEAERLLEEAPDSSLAVLERIAPASLRGRSQRAAYTLLHARAEEACFGFIPSEETAALEEAAEYYEAAGDAPQRVAAWYRLGRLQSADGALSRAIVSFEKALAAAREAKDIEAEGDVRRELAYTYNASLQHVAAARELYASWQAYDGPARPARAAASCWNTARRGTTSSATTRRRRSSGPSCLRPSPPPTP